MRDLGGYNANRRDFTSPTSHLTKVAELGSPQPTPLPHPELVEGPAMLLRPIFKKNHTNLSNTISPRLF
ncbi:hypothetical protein SAMN05443582_101457 [Phyllobacterium sp. OV277]|nr:hypothetical protein SAMN05443582_101457 [Phyllobacterium sp. OV277]